MDKVFQHRLFQVAVALQFLDQNHYFDFIYARFGDFHNVVNLILGMAVLAGFGVKRDATSPTQTIK